MRLLPFWLELLVVGLGDGVVPAVGVVPGVLVGVTPIVGVGVGLTCVGVGDGAVGVMVGGVVTGGVELTAVGMVPPTGVAVVDVAVLLADAVGVAFLPKGPLTSISGRSAVRPETTSCTTI